MDGSYFYFSTEWDKITLGGVDFDGKVILKDGLSDMESGIMDNGISGGTISIVSNFVFSIVRHNSYSGTSDFFSDFYPTVISEVEQPKLTAKTVDVGIVWRGATTLEEITWIESYYIQQPTVYYNRIECFCVGFDELSNTQIPHYVVQKEVDNDISYFPDAPEDSMGQTIPIVYGDFTTLDLPYQKYNLVPGIPTLKDGHNYIFSSHICKEVYASASIFDYISGAFTVRRLYETYGAHSNTRAGYNVQLATYLKYISGEIKFHPRGYISGGSDYEKSVDDDSTTYAVLPVNDAMIWQIGSDVGNIGFLNGVMNDAALIIEWDANGGNVDFQVKLFHVPLNKYHSLVASGNSALTGQTINYYFGQGNYDYGSNPCKYQDTADWNMSELEEVEFHIFNLSSSAGEMRIKNIYFQIQNTTVYEKYALTMAGKRSGILDLEFTGIQKGNASYTVYGKKIRYNQRDAGGNNALAYMKGQIIDSDML
jgi:hypothetical protein